MPEPILPAAFALFAWWLGTGAVLLALSAPRRWTLSIASLLAVAALAGLWIAADRSTVGAAYCAFCCALVVWAWHELAFLTGALTGPRKQPLPAGARGWLRFRLATEAVIHHELALAATLLLLAAISFRAPNQVGTLTFLVLWTMRLSTKLNLFFGVRDVATEFIPEHLRYLLTYFRRARVSPLMPLSIAISAAVAARLCWQASIAGPGSFALTATALLASLLSLGVLEHLFLALPLPDALLWRWALRRPAVPKEIP